MRYYSTQRPVGPGTFPKLLLSKRIADWEYVDFLLMLLEKFPILVHDLVSSTFR